MGYDFTELTETEKAFILDVKRLSDKEVVLKYNLTENSGEEYLSNKEALTLVKSYRQILEKMDFDFHQLNLAKSVVIK